MTPQEIKPRQLRALLLLLFLVPLIPAALMVRFMFDTIKAERFSALERAQQSQSEDLASFLDRYQPPEGNDAEKAKALLKAWAKTAEPSITARVLDARGQLLAGEPHPWDRPLVSAPAPGLTGATLQIYFTGPEVLDQSVADQRQFLVRTGTVTIVSVMLIAGVAALTLSRQLALRELKNTSVATVAHELRTPLASMRMLVDTLREGRVRSKAQEQEYLALIAEENERLSRLAENFLTYSRLDRTVLPLRLEALSPRALALRAVGSFRTPLESAHFTFEVPEDLPAVRADRDGLIQVLANLLDNALKYTGDEKRIALRARAETGRIVFFVEDNGVGIPADQREAIFQPFYQADQKLSRSREGCGLGLSIVRQLVRAQGGEISVASTPEKGSVFTVKLPIA